MHIRVESSYVPTDGELALFRTFTAQKAAQLRRLIQEAASVPPTILHRLVPVRQGKYVFVAFDTAKDMPIAFSTCFIIETGALSYGVITDFVVLAEYRRQRIAHQMVLDIVMWMSDPDVLLASGNKQLAFLHVGIKSHMPSCCKLFEGCGFILVQGKGQNGGQEIIENIYELKLQVPEVSED